MGAAPEGRPRLGRGARPPTTEQNATPDVLLWVGYAGSYDRRNQQVTPALAKILKAANVNFAILGRDAAPAIRPGAFGDEFTFMEQGGKRTWRPWRV